MTHTSGLGSPLRRFAVPIVETVRQPLVLVTTEFQVIAANSAYYRLFHTQPGDVENRSLYDINGHAWNRADLRELLEQVLPQHLDVREFEFTQTFPGLGRRTFIVDARKLHDPDATADSILRWRITSLVVHFSSGNVEHGSRRDRHLSGLVLNVNLLSAGGRRGAGHPAAARTL